ncbi:MAG: hypothetical protein KKE64_00175, partial [Candidatus Omnitrophica bacterium]|nr:hypothetical protein [Candidatus Omnitrophota bacterium]
MKFKTTKDVLLKGLDVIQNIISLKTTLPILSNVLIETCKDNLKLTATDLNIGIICAIPVNILEGGSITVPAKRFSGIIKELPEDEVEINTKKNNIINKINVEGFYREFTKVTSPPNSAQLTAHCPFH